MLVAVRAAELCRRSLQSSCPGAGKQPTCPELTRLRCGLAEDLAVLMETSEKHRSRLPTRSEILWALLHPEVRGLGSAPGAIRSAQAEAAKLVVTNGNIDLAALEGLKGGRKVCAGLRYGSIFDGPVVAGGFNAALAHHCRCSLCFRELLLTLDDLLAHEVRGAVMPRLRLLAWCSVLT